MILMTLWRLLVTWWRSVSITTKFTISFGMLLGLILLIAVTGYLTLQLVQYQTESAIVTSTTILELVLEMDGRLEKARRLHRDFFLQYPQIGLIPAKERYAIEGAEQITSVISLSQELQELAHHSTISPALQKEQPNLDLYSSFVEQFSRTFLKSVTLITELAAPETGLQDRQQQISTQLETILQPDLELYLLYTRLELAEKQFWVTHQHSHIQETVKIGNQLEQAIQISQKINATEQEVALRLLADYVLLSEKILNLTNQIEEQFNDFNQQTELLDPISADLIRLAKAEVDQAHHQIAQTRQFAIGLLIGITLIGLIIGTLIANLLNRTVTLNIVKLTEIAQEMEIGNLEISVSIDRGDELGQLAGSLKTMATYITALIDNLEQKVHERTERLETIAMLSGHLNAILAVEPLLQELVIQLKERFNYYYTHIYIIDEQGQNLILQAGVGQIGQQLLANNHSIPLTYQNSLVAKSARLGKVIFAFDVESNPNWLPNPLLPDTRSEMVVPIIMNQQVIGVLDVQSNEVGGLDDGDANLLCSLANQIAVSMNNARLFTETKEARAIAEQALLEAEQARAKSELANSAKSEFISNMSHELRTPLNGILGYAQILKGKPNLEVDVAQGINVIEQSGHHLLTLINDILDLSKIEARKMELYFSSLHLPNFIESVVGIIYMHAQEKGLICNHEIIDVPLTVKADERRLRQVLLNLMGNAIKFTAKGQITLRVRNLTSEQSGLTKQHVSTNNKRIDGLSPDTQTDVSQIRFEVIDTGIGMSAEQLHKIFEAFEQVGDGQQYSEGTGLGLAISKRLVAMMGGQLQVVSTLGSGSRFWFDITLPVLQVHENKITAEKTTPQFIGYEGDRKTILVIDDNTSNRLVLHSLLNPLGFKVVEAVNGLEGLTFAKQTLPDLIITDLVMPKMDGIQLTVNLKQHPQLTNIPIIMVSANPVERSGLGVINDVIVDFLTKPIDINHLLQTIKTCLNITWLCENQNDEDDIISDTETLTEMVLPPPEALQQLHRLAERGSIKRIHTWVDTIMALDERYHPFAHHVQKLAKAFNELAIIELIKRY